MLRVMKQLVGSGGRSKQRRYEENSTAKMVAQKERPPQRRQ
jgi:hypothetical protein